MTFHQVVHQSIRKTYNFHIMYHLKKSFKKDEEHTLKAYSVRLSCMSWGGDRSGKGVEQWCAKRNRGRDTGNKGNAISTAWLNRVLELWKEPPDPLPRFKVWKDSQNSHG